MLNLKYSKLKDIHRSKRENYTDEFSTRIHRSLSWINRAEKDNEDLTLRIFTGLRLIFLELSTSNLFNSKKVYRLWKNTQIRPEGDYL